MTDVAQSFVPAAGRVEAPHKLTTAPPRCFPLATISKFHWNREEQDVSGLCTGPLTSLPQMSGCPGLRPVWLYPNQHSKHCALRSRVRFPLRSQQSTTSWWLKRTEIYSLPGGRSETPNHGWFLLRLRQNHAMLPPAPCGRPQCSVRGSQTRPCLCLPMHIAVSVSLCALSSYKNMV